MGEMPWLTTRQFADYWLEHPLNGREVWVLNSVPMDTYEEWYFALNGTFASPLDALAYLTEDAVGPSIAARFVWRPSPVHDGYWNVYGEDEDGERRGYYLIAEDVDAGIAAGRGAESLAEAIRLSPDADPYPD